MADLEGLLERGLTLGTHLHIGQPGCIERNGLRLESKALRRLMPEIRTEHLVAARAGVRAQAITRYGSLVDDFLIQEQGRVVHVGNAPSPAATASLNIGNFIVDKLSEL